MSVLATMAPLVRCAASFRHCAQARCDVRHAYSRRVAEKLSRPVSEAVARGRRPARSDEGGRDLLAQEVRRRDLVPVLVLHLMRSEPVYGNRIMKGIEAMTDGVLSVRAYAPESGRQGAAQLNPVGPPVKGPSSRLL